MSGFGILLFTFLVVLNYIDLSSSSSTQNYKNKGSAVLDLNLSPPESENEATSEPHLALPEQGRKFFKNIGQNQDLNPPPKVGLRKLKPGPKIDLNKNLIPPPKVGLLAPKMGPKIDLNRGLRNNKPKVPRIIHSASKKPVPILPKPPVLQRPFSPYPGSSYAGPQNPGPQSPGFQYPGYQNPVSHYHGAQYPHHIADPNLRTPSADAGSTVQRPPGAGQYLVDPHNFSGEGGSSGFKNPRK